MITPFLVTTSTQHGFLMKIQGKQQKLIGSKWTAGSPRNKEKHFELIDTRKADANRSIIHTLRSVMSGITYHVTHSELQDTKKWRRGWQ